MAVCRIQAKDLVRTRKHIRKMLQMKTQIQAVSLKIQTMKSTATMAEAMKGVSKAMGKMNRTMNMPQLQQVKAALPPFRTLSLYKTRKNTHVHA